MIVKIPCTIKCNHGNQECAVTADTFIEPYQKLDTARYRLEDDGVKLPADWGSRGYYGYSRAHLTNGHFCPAHKIEGR